MGRHTERTIPHEERALLLIAALPALGLALVGSLLLRGFLAWGHWPTPGDPDPKGFGLHYNVALTTEVIAFLAVPLTLVGLILSPRSTPRAIAAVVALIGVAAIIAFGQADPGGVTSWLAD